MPFDANKMRKNAMFAEERARWLVWFIPLFWAAAGGVYGYFLRLPGGTDDDHLFEMVTYTFIGLCLGLCVAMIGANYLRQKAQLWYCLLQIEENTRRSSGEDS